MLIGEHSRLPHPVRARNCEFPRDRDDIFAQIFSLIAVTSSVLIISSESQFGELGLDAVHFNQSIGGRTGGSWKL